MSDIRFNQWLHNSGTGGVSQVDGGHVGIGTTNPLIPVGSGNTAILNVGVVTANSFYGDASNLTGIAADKIFEGNTEVETVDTGSNGHIKFTTEGNERLRIQPDGTLVTGAQTIPTSSDIGNIYIKNASAIGSQSHQINYVSNAVFNLSLIHI